MTPDEQAAKDVAAAKAVKDKEKEQLKYADDWHKKEKAKKDKESKIPPESGDNG